MTNDPLSIIDLSQKSSPAQNFVGVIVEEDFKRWTAKRLKFDNRGRFPGVP
jgi:hypothetical protein